MTNLQDKLKQYGLKLLCYFGFHNHVEVVDDQLTQDYQSLCLAMNLPMCSPCTYLQCTRCGHSYNTRTIEFKGSCIIPETELLKAQND